MIKLNFKTLKTVYLHNDGHAVLVHEKSDKNAGTVRWVEIVEKFGPRCDFKGRLIFGSIYEFSQGPVGLVQSAVSVRAESPSLSHGSTRSKEMGIQLGTLDIKGKGWTIHLLDMPGIMCGPYTYQPDNADTWESCKDLYSWSGYNISKKHPAKPELSVTVDEPEAQLV